MKLFLSPLVKNFLFVPKRNERGTLLIIALGALGILSVISIAVSGMISSQVKLVRNLEERFMSFTAADAALKFAYWERKKEAETPNYDSLSEIDTERQLTLGKVKVTYQLTDEESKVNINTAPLEVVQALPGINNDSELANKIIASRPISVKEQLFLVDAKITLEMFKQLQDVITIWPCDGNLTVNINTVSPEALRAIGFSDIFTSAVVNFRNRGEAVSKDAANLSADLQHIVGDLGEQDARVMTRVNFLVKSKIFTMDLKIKFQNQIPRKFKITFDIGDDHHQVLSWQEN